MESFTTTAVGPCKDASGDVKDMGWGVWIESVGDGDAKEVVMTDGTGGGEVGRAGGFCTNGALGTMGGDWPFSAGRRGESGGDMLSP